MKKSSKINSNPVLKILSNALKFWIQSQCEAINELELELTGTTLGLMKGQLKGIKVEAKEVIFQGLPIYNAKLESGPLEIKIDFQKPEKKISLGENFNLTGRVLLSDEQLNKAFLTARMKDLGNDLSREITGEVPLGQISFKQDKFVLRASKKRNKEAVNNIFQINSRNGKIIILDQISGKETIIPMDNAIYIKKAEIRASKLFLEGLAKVTL